MTRLTTLDDHSVQMIQASYSISSLKDCVLELVVNSIDAQSTCIQVSLHQYIQVIDNGSGMELTELKRVCEGTSKDTISRKERKETCYFGYRQQGKYMKVSPRFVQTRHIH